MGPVYEPAVGCVVNDCPCWEEGTGGLWSEGGGISDVEAEGVINASFCGDAAIEAVDACIIPPEAVSPVCNSASLSWPGPWSGVSSGVSMGVLVQVGPYLPPGWLAHGLLHTEHLPIMNITG